MISLTVSSTTIPLFWVVSRFLLSSSFGLHVCNASISCLTISFTSLLSHLAPSFFLYGRKSRVHSFEIHLASLFDNFLIENIKKNFGLHFKQNHMHPGFPIASYSPGLNFKYLIQYRFPQYSHSSILSFSLLKIFSQSSHFPASLTSLPDSEFLLLLHVPLFF